ncbi:Na+/H+ antiporter NhaA [Oligoflexus tunisiensis]|uniref:Na+/H+ antiporter NhaA n=1 Tax=Oligoflexus tunisiensis TaxID=708132 RepID=UPI000AD61E91|nr:Na+/H+ antiporter NhaA [Oligoflexus tunisiensis]
MTSHDQNLPRGRINQFTAPLARFLKVEAAAGALLLGVTAVAVLITNSPWSEPFLQFWEAPVGFHFGPLVVSRSLQHWINDGLMTLFFFVVALELKRELVLGELRSLRMAMLPLAGALGGMLFPALFYLALMRQEPELHGWGTVMATDTAFMIGCLAILGSRIPASLRLFLLSLAIFDDVGAILVVAFGYGDAVNWTALGLGLAGFAIVAGAAWLGTRSVSIYSILGIVIWVCFDASGLHATLVGVILGLMTPTRGWVSDTRLRSILAVVLSYPKGEHWSGDTVDRRDLRKAMMAARETLSPVERLEMRLHPWVGFAIMPVFALANAGVVISLEALGQPVALAIVIALVLGKPAGVLCMSWLAVRMGVATLFSNLNWGLIAAGGLLTGIGFTMSLFIAGLAYDPASLTAAKIGILTASLIAATAGILALLGLTSSRARE